MQRSRRNESRIILSGPGRSALLVAFTVVVLALMIWWQAARWYEARLLVDQRLQIEQALSPYADVLTRELNQRLTELDGLAAFALVNGDDPDFGRAFETFAAGLAASTNGLRTVQIFPQQGAVLVYPVAGNEATLGRTLSDLINDERPAVRQDVQRTIESGQITLSNPYQLRQGGLGLVARKAVFQGESFWGMTTIVLDLPPLLMESGIADPPTNLDLGLQDTSGVLIAGSEASFSADPVTRIIQLPEGQWTMAAAPPGGWQAAVKDALRVFQVIGLVIVGLVTSLTYLITNRQARLALAVAERTTRLSESEERYKLVFNSTRDAMFMLDGQGRILDVNQAVFDRYGYSRDELLKMKASDLATIDLRPQVPERVREALETGSQFSWRHLRKDGTELPVEISASPLKLNGRDYVLSSVRDVTERNKSEEALRTSELRFRALVEQSLTGIYVFQEDRFLYVNRRFTEIFGYSEEEVLAGLLPTDVIAKTDKAMAAENVRRRLSGEVDSVHYTARGLCKDGSLIWVEIHGNRIEIDGQPVVAGTVLDITERTEAEARLRESETRFRSLIREMVSGFALHEILCDDAGNPVDYRFLGVNPAFEMMIGLKAVDVVGKTVLELLPELDSHWIETVGRVALTGEPVLIDDFIGPWEGHFEILVYRPTEMQFAAIFTDVSERTRAEQALRNSNERLAVLREIDRGIVTAASPQDIVKLVLSRIRRLVPSDRASLSLVEEETNHLQVFALAYDQDSATGSGRRIPIPERENMRLLLDGETVIVPDLRAVIGEALPIRNALLEEGLRSNITVPLLTRGRLIGLISASSMQANVYSKEHQNIMEEIGNQVAIALDQSYLMEQIERQNEMLEERVRQRTAELETANREMEAFTYSVSHDLKAPLRGLDGYSRLLMQKYHGQMDEEGETFLNNVRSATQQMNRLIDELLAYSRLERRPQQVQQIRLRDTLDAMLVEMDGAFKETKTEVTLDVPDITLSVDPEGLSLVMRNLLDNALKFVHPERRPVVEIRAHQQEASTLLSVKDNGVGFDMKYHDRIFDMFQRLNRSEQYPGTGIGLAMVRKAVERMGGRIWAESVLEEGSTFYLDIPR